MNRNQIEGSVKDIAGRFQQKMGEVTGSTIHQANGAAKQVEGKVQKGVGDVEQAVKVPQGHEYNHRR